MSHSSDKIDIKFRKNDDGIYDLNIGEDGDLEGVGGLETSFLMSFFSERRADPSEVPIPFLRRGWWGNEVTDPTAFEIGSKLWLLYQSRASTVNASMAEDFTRQAFQWLITDRLFKKLTVEASASDDTINIKIVLFNQGNNIETIHFDLLNQTVKELSDAT